MRALSLAAVALALPVVVACSGQSGSEAPATAEQAAAGDQQAEAPKTPDATVEMREFQLAFIGSGGGGSGVLRFQGQEYPIRIRGLGLGGIGMSNIEAQGEVFNLTDVSKFPGTYVRARYGYAVGNTGSGGMWMENGNGVIMRLQAQRQGLMLSLGGDAMTVSFR